MPRLHGLSISDRMPDLSVGLYVFSCLGLRRYGLLLHWGHVDVVWPLLSGVLRPHKSWAMGIGSYVGVSLNLVTPNMSTCLLKMSRMSASILSTHRLRRLCIGCVLFLPDFILASLDLDDSNDSDEISRFDKRHSDCSSLSMKDAAAIINLCRHNLTELKIKFSKSVGFSQDLIKAIGDISSLKVFMMLGSKSRKAYHDFGSITKVLDVTTNVESLSIDCGSLGPLDIKASSLPRLIHLWAPLYLDTHQCFNEFVRAEGRDIKFLECFSPDAHGLCGSMIVGLNHCLEILFVDSVPDNLSRVVLDTHFPKLKVIRSIYSTTYVGNLAWFQWPMFSAMEVFITSYWHGRFYWQRMMSQVGIVPIPFPPKLKHIIFVSWNGPDSQNAYLVKQFASVGIKCLFEFEMTTQQILWPYISFAIAVAFGLYDSCKKLFPAAD
ncbi:uncharacterized protein MELLADRAFT_108616 [Melampsora larici-populina 98AG31]|uniref:Uncharacterized protein n=1 Tax=Melampsora larici-populina (strain 98AG31 / pathotype 3-4-7) TaxID=747676 RepID=F4RTP4_MELLP|nr:uncharacterized protein MELLADRAFT_108616 [Melampsora larici-populina 98AG31]EGG04303.1 hypothetical protein MELLADRAFT_108616 [Melampsora larici-populina 98AG31]